MTCNNLDVVAFRDFYAKYKLPATPIALIYNQNFTADSNNQLTLTNNSPGLTTRVNRLKSSTSPNSILHVPEHQSIRTNQCLVQESVQFETTVTKGNKNLKHSYGVNAYSLFPLPVKKCIRGSSPLERLIIYDRGKWLTTGECLALWHQNVRNDCMYLSCS